MLDEPQLSGADEPDEPDELDDFFRELDCLVELLSQSEEEEEELLSQSEEE